MKSLKKFASLLLAIALLCGSMTVSSNALTSISAVDFRSLPFPEAGKTADPDALKSRITVASGQNFTVSEACWYNESEGYEMQNDDIFSSSEEYYIQIILKAKTGYIFDDEAAINVTNSPAEIDSDNSIADSDMLYVYTKPEKPKKHIDEIVITSFTGPNPGKTVNDSVNRFAVSSDKGYKTKNVSWSESESDGVPLLAEYVFEAGKAYTFSAEFTCDSGYYADDFTNISGLGLGVSGSYNRTTGTFCINAGFEADFSQIKITFNANEGIFENTGTDKLIVTFPAGVSFSPEGFTVPERDEYEFLGFYTSKSGGEAVDESLTFSSDTELFAHWANYDAPENLKAEYAGDGKISLSWDAIDSADSYIIFKYDSARGGYAFLGQSKTAGYIDANIAPGTHKYQVSAYFNTDFAEFETNASAVASVKVTENTNAEIKAVAADTVNYGTMVTVIATANGVDKGYHLEMTVNGITYIGTGTQVKSAPLEIRANTTYTVKIISDSTGAEQKQLTKQGEIMCKSNIILKILAFFMGLFGLLPSKTIQP